MINYRSYVIVLHILLCGDNNNFKNKLFVVRKMHTLDYVLLINKYFVLFLRQIN